MAIVKMKRLTLAVVRSQKKQLLEELIKHGCIQFSVLDGVLQGSEAETLLKSESSRLMQFKSQLASIEHAISILNRYSPQKTPLLSAKPEIEAEDFLDETGLRGSVEIAEKIEEKDDRIKRLFAEISRENSTIESLKPWEDFGMPLQCEGTEYASVLLGTVPARLELTGLEVLLAQVSEETELFHISSDKANSYIAVICLKNDVAKVQEVLRNSGFSASAFSGLEGTARECISKSQNAIKEYESEKELCVQSICDEAVRRDELKLASDKLRVKISMAESEEKLLGTESTVLMQGWMPEEDESEISELLEKYDCAWETEEPGEDEYPQVPIKLKNNFFTNGLNMVTNMYSLPAYGTVDPNPLMAPFFITFYGLMMADIGYGIIMIIAAIVAFKKLRPREGMLSFCQLLLWGGIATTICGILTGGFFSDVLYQFYIMLHPEGTWLGLPHLFNPTEQSIQVLIGALVLGVLHLNAGMVVSFVQKVKAGNVKSAIWEEGTLWLLLLTGIIFALSKTGIAPWIPQTPALVLLIIAVLLLLVGAGRDAKGFGKVTAAFSCIYNTATGWFGDILSYSRIMALMLAGGVVGQVFNTVALMPMKNSGPNVITILAFIIIFVLGHAMNFGLNLLGCYVHDLRLQCLEFFGKFYQDGGKPFEPMRVKGKYINVKQ